MKVKHITRKQYLDLASMKVAVYSYNYANMDSEELKDRLLAKDAQEHEHSCFLQEARMCNLFCTLVEEEENGECNEPCENNRLE